MVGVAGRSKGCNTCKKRKIACGLQRPQCAQCIKSNRLCTGYQRQHVFIVNKDLPNVHRPPSHDAKVVYTPAIDAYDSRPDRIPLVANGVPIGRQRKPPKKNGVIASVSSVPAYRQMLFDCFLRSYVPLDELGPSEDDDWLGTLAMLPNQPPCLTAAMLAMSLSQVGKANNDEHISKESLRHYTVGLRELQKALYDPDQMHTDETLAACFVLSFYELLECPDGDKRAYAQHNKACAKLIQLRGPKGYRKGLAHSLFVAIRPQIIFQFLDRHEHTFLTDPSWLENPWLQRPKSAIDRIIDYIAQAPGIFGTTDNFSRMEPVAILATALSIIDKCWKMDTELQDFYLHLETSIPGPIYWPVLSTTDNPADEIDKEKGKVFPVAFHFFNLRMAGVLTLYWANLCMMYHGMTLLYYRVMAIIPVDRRQIYSRPQKHIVPSIPALLREGIPDCPDDCVCRSPSSNGNHTPCIALFDMSKLKPLGHRDDFLTPGRNVCQSVEYCLQPKMLDMGPGSIAAPMAIVLATIKEYPFAQRELEWGREVMRGLEGRLPYLRWVRI